MRRVISIRTMTGTSDGMGGTTPGAPVDIPNIPARVEPLLGDEQVSAMQTGMVAPHRFTMRYRQDVLGASLLVYDGRTFDVKSVVDPEEKHRELVILADEVEAT